jgi:hypothetical protein
VLLNKIDHKLAITKSLNEVTLMKRFLKWFKQQRSENVPVSGPLLMARAEELAKLLSDKEFVYSAGWIDRFKLCHNISCRKVSGEARAVDCEMTAEWLSTVWPKMR